MKLIVMQKIYREGKEEWVPVDWTPYCSTSGFDAVSPIFQEVNLALLSMNISVDQVNYVILHHCDSKA